LLLTCQPQSLANDGQTATGNLPCFQGKIEQTNKRLGLKQFLVPYLISGHPGCDLSDAIELALEIKRQRVMPEQVQDFYPTPGTVSTVMYYTGLDPMTLQPVHVPKERKKLCSELYCNLANRRTVTRFSSFAPGRPD
jgi:radical SAM superfamily enzyme YgiQ (UPF0313 family)